MSTQAEEIAGALLSDTNFASLVASLKEKRDTIASYQYSLASYATQTANLQGLLATAIEEEATTQAQVLQACATLIATKLA